MAGGPVAVLGATGYTGRLVCDELRSLGIPLRLLGRDPAALRAAAAPDDEVAAADVMDFASLEAAFAEAFAVVSTAGPFLERGFGTVEAALGAGAHYVDSSTEQAFSRHVYERFGGRAAEAGVVVLTAFANAAGDLTAAIAADGLEPPLVEVIVANDQSGFSLSRGSRETLARVMEQPQAAWDGGRLVPSRFGATTRSVRFPSGEKTAVEWGGPEPLTVPRHVEVGRVRSYVRAPRAAAAAGRFSRRLAPLIGATARAGRAGPRREKRQRARYAIVVEARAARGGRRVTLLGRDVYGSAARVLACGAEALRNGEARSAGALAPAEAFDPVAFLERLAPFVQLESTIEL